MEDIIEKVLGKINARFAEVRYMKIKMNVITVKNGVVNSVASTEEDGFAVRVVNEGIGFAATNDVSKLSEIAERAKKLAKNRKNKVYFSQEKSYEDSWSVEEKKKIENMDIEEKIDYLLDVGKRLGAQMKIQMLRDKEIEKIYMNSEGTKIRAKIPRVEYF